MMRQFSISILLVALFIYTACNQPKGKNVSVVNVNTPVQSHMIQFQVYGELVPAGYLDESDTLLTHPLGFELKRVADCEVSDSLVKSVNQHNAVMREQMSKKYGTYWIDSIEIKTGKRFHRGCKLNCVS